MRYFWVALCIFFFEVTLCNKPTAALRHWKWYRTGTFIPYSTPLWTIGFSSVTYIKLWWSVKGLQKNALNILGTRSTVDILTSDNSFFLTFPALTDNRNNFEINSLIKLVVSEMFLLPYSASLMSFSSF